MTEKIQKGRFTPWCWEAERDEYNDRSRRGWHLKKRSLRDMSYEYDPSVQYRYALDYRRQHNEEFYLEFFAEDGWELVGTVTDAYTGSNPGKRLFVSHWDGCWYIFRKPYRPGSPEADYEIATDEASLSELQNTLHRKYRRLMIWEALWLIGYLAVHLTMDQSRFIFSDYILLAAGGLCFLSTLYRWLCVRVLRPRKALRIFVDYRAIACVLLTLCFLLLLSLVISDSSAPEEPDTVPVTSALSRQRYYHAESPEEILSIAYPVLYPDGLA